MKLQQTLFHIFIEVAMFFSLHFHIIAVQASTGIGEGHVATNNNACKMY